MFTLTNGPSAIVHLLQNLLLTGIDQREWYNATLVCRFFKFIFKNFPPNFLAL